ncbi:shugoshin 2 isoform X1 [Cavia porcellus]|uniref:Shugoshin 2 n=3 Tax=Cavia porcellus TaxID=10141 RepID=H0UZ74_CAVPO|nr:shugoshin 2 isoform X1 [Cavia porcellus]
MESLGMRTDSVTSAIKRHVKDKRASKATLNVSLASKIKTKIINNSSIFKISLKHNNRALAQALSREKENSRRIATEKMLLQKEVEKLNFKNTFLQLKLDNLNKKLIEIESLLSNNLITAIEMSSLSEFHQSSFLPSTSKKKRPSRQCELVRLPFARVPLSSNDDDDDDDKEKTPRDNGVTSRLSPDAASSVSVRQSVPAQCNVDLVLLKESNWSMCGPDDTERISSRVSVPPKEGHSHLERSSQCSVVGETTNGRCNSHGREKLSLSNVTARKKRASSWASDSPAADAPWGAASGQQHSLSPRLDQNVESEGCTNESSTTVPGSPKGPAGLENPPAPLGKPSPDSVGRLQGGGDPQGQTTVYGADMELTATDMHTIITVSRGSRQQSSRKMNNCEHTALRKVRDRNSGSKRERSKRKCKTGTGTDATGQAENGPEGGSARVGGREDAGDPDSILSAAWLPPVSLLRKTALHQASGWEDRCSGQYSGAEKASEQGPVPSSSPGADGALKEGGTHESQRSLACSKSKASRQTFVICNLEKDCLFPNQKEDKENVEVAHEFQTADLSSRENGNVHDCETQNISKLKKCVPGRQSQSKVSHRKQRVNRKTEVISQVQERHEEGGADGHAPQQGNAFLPQVDTETISGNMGLSDDFQILSPFLRDQGNLCDHETQNLLGLQKPVTTVYPVQQNESKINKKLRQKVNRKTEIISEVKHFDDEKSQCCSEKGVSFWKEKEAIPRRPTCSGELQTPAVPTQGCGEPCDHKALSVLAARTQPHGMTATCWTDSETGALRRKACPSTEITLERSRTCVRMGEGLQALGTDGFAALTQKRAETISANPEVTCRFQTVDLPTRDHGKVDNWETQKNSVTGMQLPQQNESKAHRKLRQKVNRKTEIISEMIQIYEDIDNDVHGQKNYSEDLDFKINTSKPRLGQQGLRDEYYMEITSGVKENYSQISDPSELVQEHKQRSPGKAEGVRTRDRSRPTLPWAGMTGTSSGPDSATSKCQATGVTKVTSRGKHRKTSALLPGSAHLDQENQWQGLQTMGTEADSHSEVSQRFSRGFPPDMRGLSSDGVCAGAVPASVSSTKVLVVKDGSFPAHSPILQVPGDGHEKTEEARASAGQRTQKATTGNRTLQDLTNTSCFASSTVKSESASEGGASEPPSKKRRCAPLSLKEPNLKRKMRR